MEDVHLHGVVREGIGIHTGAQLVAGLLGHLGEVHEQTLQGGAGHLGRLRLHVGGASARDGATPERFSLMLIATLLIYLLYMYMCVSLYNTLYTIYGKLYMQYIHLYILFVSLYAICIYIL